MRIKSTFEQYEKSSRPISFFPERMGCLSELKRDVTDVCSESSYYLSAVYSLLKPHVYLKTRGGNAVEVLLWCKNFPESKIHCSVKLPIQWSLNLTSSWVPKVSDLIGYALMTTSEVVFLSIWTWFDRILTLEVVSSIRNSVIEHRTYYSEILWDKAVLDFKNTQFVYYCFSELKLLHHERSL